MAGLLTDAQIEGLKNRRKRFTDEDIETALKYMLDNPDCTLEQAATKHGMTAQTLGQRRDKLLADRKAAASGNVAPPAPVKTEAKAPAKTQKGGAKK